ncbi:MAG TPA: hypothetical protein VFS77_22620, partial [Pyrinomonadaceae bacterium]|nr:hypothetical protein [Pyrinomonadaceae bacterium]
ELPGNRRFTDWRLGIYSPTRAVDEIRRSSSAWIREKRRCSVFEALYMSKSGVSKQIRDLEGRSGQAFISRTNRSSIARSLPQGSISARAWSTLMSFKWANESRPKGRNDALRVAADTVRRDFFHVEFVPSD